MRPGIIIKLLLLMAISVCAFGQTDLDDSLLLHEYRYYKCNSDTCRQKNLLKKIDLYLEKEITNGDVFNEIKRVNVNYLTNEQRDFLWNASIVSYINNENSYAEFFLSEYLTASNDTSIGANLLQILVYKYTDTCKTRQIITRLSTKDSLFSKLTCFGEIVSYKRKHLNIYLLSSALLPGSGSAFNGYVLKGAISLALVSASTYAIIKMVEFGLYVNAVLWGTGVGLKFYAGNINLTEKLFYTAESKHKTKLVNLCSDNLTNILEKYPLTLKLK